MMDHPDKVVTLLEEALASQDADAVEHALGLAYTVGLLPCFVPALIQLLEADWHCRHEDIVSGLQRLKAPEAVEALYRAAFVRHEYLDYDETEGLARKCTWALADIGTFEARAKLELMAVCDNELIAGYAQRRLDRWEDEKSRK